MNTAGNTPDFDLIAKVLAGEASAEEVQLVEQWRAAGEEQEREYQLLRQVWTASEGALASEGVDVDAAWAKMEQRIPFEAENENQLSQPETKTRTISMQQWLYRAAAVVVLVIATWFAIQNLGKDPSIEMQLAEAGAESREIILPDGSAVTLNAYSSLEYPSTFEEMESRTVTLTGEAFFEVEENVEQPFIINTGTAHVKVLGTSFSVSAYDTSRVVEVNVVEGKVLLYKEDNRGYIAEEVELTSGEAAVFYKETGTIEEVAMEEADVYWKTKTLIFERTELRKVIQVLDQIFGVEVAASESISHCRLTATFRDQPVDSILQIIASTFSLEVVQEGDYYRLSGEGCQP